MFELTEFDLVQFCVCQLLTGNGHKINAVKYSFNTTVTNWLI